jgi:hypothetical protein
MWVIRLHEESTAAHGDDLSRMCWRLIDVWSHKNVGALN